MRKVCTNLPFLHVISKIFVGRQQIPLPDGHIFRPHWEGSTPPAVEMEWVRDIWAPPFGRSPFGRRDVWAPGQMGAAVSAPDVSALGATVTLGGTVTRCIPTLTLRPNANIRKTNNA